MSQIPHASILRQKGLELKVDSSQPIENKRFKPVSRTMRDAVLAEAEEFWAARDVRNPIVVISKRLGATYEEVARILVGLLLEYQRSATTLGVALDNARSQAHEAAAEVWTEAEVR